MATEQLSCSFQRVNNSLHDGLCAINALISYFTRIKSDGHFENFYSEIIGVSEYLTDEPRPPRIRHSSSRFITGTTQIPEAS